MYLQKIQKVYKIAAIVVKVLTVASFAVGAVNVIGGILCLSGVSNFVMQLGIITGEADIDLAAGGTAMVAEGIGLIATGITMVFAAIYLDKELADGDPFTESGAEAVKRVGIVSVIAAVAASFLQGLVIGLSGTDVTAVTDTSDTGITTGLLLLFFSMILHYGVQLREGKADGTPIDLEK